MSGAFWGGFLAVGLGLVLLTLFLRRRLRLWWYDLFGGVSPGQMLHMLSKAGEEPDLPRSLNGLDRLLLPQILGDFPDFDIHQAKTNARNYIKKQLSGHPGLHIYKVVISRYLTAQSQKTVVFQAAVSWREGEQTVQKRYELHDAFLLPSEDTTVAANCPNCGAALGFGVTTCAYCGSRVVNVMGNTWHFTRMEES